MSWLRGLLFVISAAAASSFVGCGVENSAPMATPSTTSPTEPAMADGEMMDGEMMDGEMMDGEVGVDDEMAEPVMDGAMTEPAMDDK